MSMETKSNIYIPKDCMNEIITQLKLLNVKKFVIIISNYPGEPEIDHLNDVSLVIVEADSDTKALESIFEEDHHRHCVTLFEILENKKHIFPKKTNLSENQLKLIEEFKELNDCDDGEKIIKFMKKYKDLLIPILINQDAYIKIQEIN